MYSHCCAALVVSIGSLFNSFYGELNTKELETKIKIVKQNLYSLLELAGFDPDRIENSITVVGIETDEECLFEFFGLASELIDTLYCESKERKDLYLYYPVVVDTLKSLLRFSYACGISV